MPESLVRSSPQFLESARGGFGVEIQGKQVSIPTVTADPLTGGSSFLGIPDNFLALEQAVFAGDSMTAGNVFGSQITAATRSNGIVTITTSADLLLDAGLFITTINIVPADMCVYRAAVTRVDATHYQYAAPGADVAAGANLGANKPMFSQNPQTQPDTGSVLWLKSKTGGAFIVKRISGHNGNTAADMLNRVTSGDLSFDGCSLAVIQTGYNDFVQDGRTAEAVLADINQVMNAASRAGAKCIIVNCVPWGAGGVDLNRAAAVRYNRLLRNLCLTRQNTRYADAARLMTDALHATPHYPKANLLTADLIHPTPRGYDLIAQSIYDSATDWLTPVDRLVGSAADCYGFDPLSKNIWDKAPWAATGGSVTGPNSTTSTGVPSGFSVPNSSAVVTVSNGVARADGIGYDLVATMTAGGVGTQVVGIGPLLQARYAPGDKIVMMCEVALSNIAASKLRGINCATAYGAIQQQPVRSGAVSNTGWVQDDRTITLISEPIIVPAGNPTTMDFSITFIFHEAGTALVAKIGRVSFEKI